MKDFIRRRFGKENRRRTWFAIVSLTFFFLGEYFLQKLGWGWGYNIAYVFFFVGPMLLFFINRKYSNKEVGVVKREGLRWLVNEVIEWIRKVAEELDIVVFRVIVPFVISLGMLVLYEYIINNKALYDVIIGIGVNDKFHMERLYESLSTLYAISTAFLLWKGLSDHDDLRKVLKEEAGQIQSIVGYLNYLDDDRNKVYANNIRLLLINYVNNLVNDRYSSHAENYSLLTSARKEVEQLRDKEGDINDRVSISEIIKGLNYLFKVRMKRIGVMETKPPYYIGFALVFMSAAIISVAFVYPSDLVAISKGVIFVLSFFMTFMIIMLFDISSPFLGFYKIKNTSFEDVRKILETEVDINS